MVNQLLGRKIGMTQIYREDGACVPVTVLEAGPCLVRQVKSLQTKDKYCAIQISFGSRKKRRVPRAELGHLVPRIPGEQPEDRKKRLDAELAALKDAPESVHEIPWDGKGEVKVGDTLTVEIFETIRKVDVQGVSKGRGWMGAIGRWNFHRQPATHGQSDRERAPGSLGRQHSISQGVYPGKRMAGHWGHEVVTVRNLDVAHIDKAKNLIMVYGGVPGPNGGLLVIKQAKWVPPKTSIVVSKKTKAGKK